MQNDNSARSIRIGHTYRFLTITVIEPSSEPTLAVRLARGYSHHVEARIEAVVDGFRASYIADLFGVDLPGFRQAIARLYSFESSKAVFETPEDELKIEITGDGRGHFKANCVARKYDADAFPCFTFTLQFDQTEIPRMLAELDAVLGRTP
jgi:hypothetical protein